MTDIIALLSTLLSPLPWCDCFGVRPGHRWGRSRGRPVMSSVLAPEPVTSWVKMVPGGVAGGCQIRPPHSSDRCCGSSDERAAMSVARRIILFIAAVGLLATVVAPTASAQDRKGPVVTPLASFGDGAFVTGSTIGPGGALYVTDGSAGSVLRIDRRTGQVTTYATGLPTKAFATDIGGPVDVVFVGRTAYVLVTLVSGEIFGEPFGDADDKNGIYRLERDGSFTLVADIGGWSVDNPPEPAFFVDTGVQYAMEVTTAGSWSLMGITIGCWRWDGTARSTRSRPSGMSCRPGSK